jgi:hypothetical protein
VRGVELDRWWEQVLYLGAILALVYGGSRVARALLPRDRRRQRRWVDRFLDVSEWVVGIGMVFILVLSVIALAFW